MGGDSGSTSPQNKTNHDLQPPVTVVTARGEKGPSRDSKRREKRTRSKGTLIQWLEPPTPGSWHFFTPRLTPRLLQNPSSTYYHVFVPGASITDTPLRYSTGNDYYTAYARDGSGNPHSVPTTIQCTGFEDFLVTRSDVASRYGISEVTVRWRRGQLAYSDSITRREVCRSQYDTPQH